MAAAWVGALSVLSTSGSSQSFHPFTALPRNRFTALVLRVAERQKSIVLPELVERTVQTRPPATEPDVGLVDAPTPRPRSAPLPAQALLHFRSETLYPAINCRVVDGDATFGHHRFEIAVADRVPALPTHRPQHDLTAEVTSLDIVHAPTPPSNQSGEFTTQAESRNRATSITPPTRPDLLPRSRAHRIKARCCMCVAQMVSAKFASFEKEKLNP